MPGPIREADPAHTGTSVGTAPLEPQTMPRDADAELLGLELMALLSEAADSITLPKPQDKN